MHCSDELTRTRAALHRDDEQKERGDFARRLISDVRSFPKLLGGQFPISWRPKMR